MTPDRIAELRRDCANASPQKVYSGELLELLDALQASEKRATEAERTLAAIKAHYWRTHVAAKKLLEAKP